MEGVILRESPVDFPPRITCPSLIFSGVEDNARPPAWAKEVADGIPNSGLVTLHDAGHSPRLEAPDTVYPRIIDFFETHNK
jgi:3-oxoadipate enol-lactonase